MSLLKQVGYRAELRLPWIVRNSEQGFKYSPILLWEKVLPTVGVQGCPEADLIVTGDNHKPFIAEYKGRILVNAGSFTNQKWSEQHQPRVYLWNAETNKVKVRFLLKDEDDITDAHLQKDEETIDLHFEEFLSAFNKELSVFDFEEYLEYYLTKVRIRKEVKDKIYEFKEVV